MLGSALITCTNYTSVTAPSLIDPLRSINNQAYRQNAGPETLSVLCLLPYNRYTPETLQLFGLIIPSILWLKSRRNGGRNKLLI